jgi:hypothetical protein
VGITSTKNNCSTWEQLAVYQNVSQGDSCELHLEVLHCCCGVTAVLLAALSFPAAAHAAAAAAAAVNQMNHVCLQNTLFTLRIGSLRVGPIGLIKPTKFYGYYRPP